MRIAIALFEGAEELDFVGPWEVLAAWRFLYPHDVEVILVAEGTVPVTCAKGMRVVAHASWDELGDVDVLVYPGGRGRAVERHRSCPSRVAKEASLPSRSLSTPSPGK